MAAKLICNECGWECEVDTPIVTNDDTSIQCPQCKPLDKLPWRNAQGDGIKADYYEAGGE